MPCPSAHKVKAQVATMLSPEQLRSELLSDGELSAAELGRPLAEQLRLAGPWGQGFEEPLFDGVFAVAQWKVLKERHLKLVLRTAAGQLLNAIWFAGWQGTAPADRMHVAYRLAEDDFRGGQAIQLLVEHAQPA